MAIDPFDFVTLTMPRTSSPRTFGELTRLEAQFIGGKAALAIRRIADQVGARAERERLARIYRFSIERIQHADRGVVFSDADKLLRDYGVSVKREPRRTTIRIDSERAFQQTVRNPHEELLAGERPRSTRSKSLEERVADTKQALRGDTRERQDARRRAAELRQEMQGRR